jgi:hypothetical protein
MRQCLFALLGLLLQPAIAFSMSLNGSSVFFEERPALVAIDRSIVGMKSDFGRSNDWLNSAGAKHKLGQDFSEKVMTASGAVERHYQVEANYSQFTPYWGYGLTSHWSIYAAVPVVHVSSKANATYSSPAMSLTGHKGQEAFSNRDKGSVRAPYDDQEDTIVGQFYFVSQIDWLHRPESQVVFSQKLRVPTGEHDSLAYYTRGSPEASGYGLELGLLSNTDGPALTQFLAHVKGELNFPDTIYGRDTDDPNGNLRRIGRDPGETVEGGVGIEKEVFSNILVSADYSYIRNFGDKLEEHTTAFSEGSEAHVVRGALAYQPPSFLSHQSFNDQNYSGRLIYSDVVAGKNVAGYQSVGLEISVAY